ncbi:sensor histidine kinase [Qaidamihabitans albus]|uniref:sensor histidine kinase n=1 Tax=Qaidamihabitans albus TaxID=2795733 RepID=UPI0018F2495D|nr:sensor histidine kinase [Qaidamihabitans albus]
MSSAPDRPPSALLPVEAGSPWQPWLHRLETALPHVLLGISVALSIADTGDTWQHQWTTLGLAAVAAMWVLLTDTLPPARLRTPVWLAVSFAGLLAIAAVLMSRDIVFLVFMISGFFRAIPLRPPPVMLLALASTSVLINSLGSGGPIQVLRDWPYPFLVIVIVQTAAIALGARMSGKLAEQNEQRRVAVSRLEAALEENAGLHRQLLTQAREAGVLDERQRLSREIHDTLAQGFTGIITQIEAARQAGDDPAGRERHLAAASALARDNLTETRRSVHALSPAALGDAGLPAALAGVVDRWSNLTGTAAEFTTTGTPLPLHPEVEMTLLRITQEALANVGRHARASRVGLTLSYMDDQVTLDVRDDGAGFEPDAATRNGAFGLRGMRHRVQRLAGTLAVESEPGEGTAISATVPAIIVREQP